MSCWLQIGIAALIQTFKGRPYSIPTGADGQWAQYVPLTKLIGARFILFRVRGDLKSLNLCRDYVARVETTFRIALKGGLAFFSRDEGKLCVRSLHFDGHMHYHRRLDLDRIVRGFADSRNGVCVHSEIELDDNSSNHREQNAQSYDDCQLLQLTDILVSGFRSVLADGAIDAHRQVSRPLAELSEKWNRGRKGFSRSRWSNGFCISEGYIENGHWQFSSVNPNLCLPYAGLFEGID